MDKYAELRGQVPGGRPLIHLVEPGSCYGLSASAGLDKTASGEHLPEVMELVESIQAQPGRLYLVNSALGAGEWVGFNLRGDWFTERGLLHEPAGWRDVPVWDIDGRRRLAAETEHVPGWGYLSWGYPTFYNAHRFRHHQNKDPERAYGYILGAFWDARMHRVVLVSELVRDMCAKLGALDIYRRIENGEFPDTSIGIKVPYDRCFIESTYVATERGPRQIHEIAVGDLVYTTQGNLRRVTHLFKHENDGEMVRIRTHGHLPICATANHPFFCIPKARVRSCIGSGGQRRHAYDGGDTCTYCGRGHLDIEQVDAEELRPGDYLLTPVVEGGTGPEYGSQLSYVAGVYAGDGSAIRQRRGRKRDGSYVLQGLQFSCNVADAHVDKLVAALAELSGKEPCIYDEGNGKCAVSVRIYDQALAHKITTMVGGKGADKRLVVPLDCAGDRLAFLAGLIDSDGCWNEEKGSCRITSTSPALVRAAWELAVRSRIRASLSSCEVSGESGYARNFNTMYTVYLPAECAARLESLCGKARVVEKEFSNCRSFFWTSDSGQLYLCRPVTGVDQYEQKVTVHNFSVEGDETYVAEGAAVHNCSYCNHVAKTPADYCEHVRRGAKAPYGMLSILPDGRQCGVYNDYPRGFDDSFVFVGAERSAKVMADVTARVRGSRSYSDKLYHPRLRGKEAVADASGLPSGEQERRLALAVDEVDASRVRGPVEHGFADAVSRCLSEIPAADDREHKALRYAADYELKRAAQRDGTVSDEERRFWEARGRADLRASGVEEDHEARALANLRAKLDALGMPKLGSLAKWATITKQVPVPTSAQSALLRDHTSRLSRVLPKAVEECCAESPASMWEMLSHLANLGVVLRPDEFQSGMLRAMGEGALADRCVALGERFARTPLDPQRDPPWVPRRSSVDMLESLAQLLGASALGRSFAPRVVAIRIYRPPPVTETRSEKIASAVPVLNRVSQMYNDYRTGLVTHPPDWSCVPIDADAASLSGGVKLADSAGAVSRLLLHLAYW